MDVRGPNVIDKVLMFVWSLAISAVVASSAGGQDQDASKEQHAKAWAAI